MSDQLESRVGMRIRFLRNQRELSLRALSSQCGLSINAISQIERGESSPTLSSLQLLATALGVPLTALLEDETKQEVMFLKCGQRPCNNGDGFVMESLGTGLPNQQLEPFLITLEPGDGSAANPITHPGEEFAYCLEGEIEYRIGDRLYRLEPHDSIAFEAAQPHCFYNPGESDAKLLVVFQAVKDSHIAHQGHLHI
jgi:transcriptional regulator with XRE-family HTH domain